MSDLRVINAYGQKPKGLKITPHDETSGGNKVNKITAPGYHSRVVIEDFARNKVDPILLWMNPEKVAPDPVPGKGPAGLTSACAGNLWLAAYEVRLQNYRLVDFLYSSPVESGQDRCYFRVHPTTSAGRLHKSLDTTGVFERADGSLHHPHEEEFEQVGSWKTTRGAPVLQVTLWMRDEISSQEEADANNSGTTYIKSTEFVAELDIDLHKGLGHLKEVIGNHLTGNKTHPYDVVQALVYNWGVCPFVLEVKDEAS